MKRLLVSKLFQCSLSVFAICLMFYPLSSPKVSNFGLESWENSMFGKQFINHYNIGILYKTGFLLAIVSGIQIALVIRFQREQLAMRLNRLTASLCLLFVFLSWITVSRFNDSIYLFRFSMGVTNLVPGRTYVHYSWGFSALIVLTALQIVAATMQPAIIHENELQEKIAARKRKNEQS